LSIPFLKKYQQIFKKFFVQSAEFAPVAGFCGFGQEPGAPVAEAFIGKNW
jgi:hypothetical protein